jgi:hypothetical protein
MLQSIRLASLTIAGMIFVPVWMLFFVYRDWTAAIRLFGFRRALRAGWRKGRLRFRQPFRQVMFSAPGFSSLVPLVLLGALLYARSTGPENVRVIIVATGLGISMAYLKRAPNPALPLLCLAITAAFYAMSDLMVMRASVALAVLCGLTAVFHPLLGLVPPVVLFLGSSDYAGFLTMKRLQQLGAFQVLSLIDQASPDVSRQYVAHYGGLGPDPTAPRFDSLRTRTKWWKPTVRELMETTPILVLDTRTATPAVVGELGWALTPSLYDKTLFLVGDNGAAPAFDAALPPWTDRRILQKQIVTEQTMSERIRERTRSRGALSQNGVSPARPPALEKLFHEMGAEARTLDALRQLLFTEGIADTAIDQGFAMMHRAAPDRDPAQPPLPVSTSLEQALALARRRYPACTISLHIHHNGLAKAEIGLWDSSGRVRVFNSQDDMEPPKAVLHAMLEAELEET